LEYFRWAQGAQASEDRTAWLSMAEFWQRLAQRAEQGAQTPMREPPGREAPNPRADPTDHHRRSEVSEPPH